MQMTHLAQFAFLATLWSALGCQPNVISEQRAPHAVPQAVEATETPPTPSQSPNEAMPKVGKIVCQGREYRIKSAVISTAARRPSPNAIARAHSRWRTSLVGSTRLPYPVSRIGSSGVMSISATLTFSTAALPDGFRDAVAHADTRAKKQQREARGRGTPTF